MNLFGEYHFNYDYHAINLQKKYLMMVIVLVHLKINPKCDIFSFYIEGGEIDCWEIHQNFSKIFIDFFHRNISNIRSRRNWLITFIHTMQFMPCVIMLIRKKKNFFVNSVTYPKIWRYITREIWCISEFRLFLIMLKWLNELNLIKMKLNIVCSWIE